MSAICAQWTRHSYEFRERVAIIMEACGMEEPEAIAAAQRQKLESQSRRMIAARTENAPAQA